MVWNLEYVVGRQLREASQGQIRNSSPIIVTK